MDLAGLGGVAGGPEVRARGGRLFFVLGLSQPKLVLFGDGRQILGIIDAATLLVLGGIAAALMLWQRRQVEREIRRRILAERAQAETNAHHRSLFDHHPHSVYSIDLHGTFIDMNPAGVELSGYTPAETRGMHFARMLPAEEVERVRERFEAVKEQRRPDQFETVVACKDRGLVEARVTVLPIIVGGELVGVYGISEDMTQRNALLHELEQARATAEEANEAKSLFLANVSHEIRTPLTRIRE